MSKSATEVIRHEGEIFCVRSDHGWGVIVVNENTGLFMAYTDYGNYCHHWPSPGEKGLKHFLTDIDYHYAMGKFTGTRYGKVFRADRAIQDLKETIIERRRDDSIDRETARDAWDELRHAEDHGYSKDTFMVWIRDSSFILDAIGHDDWWCGIDGMVNDPQCVGFWNEIFIPFVASYCPDHKIKAVST